MRHLKRDGRKRYRQRVGEEKGAPEEKNPDTVLSYERRRPMVSLAWGKIPN